MVHHSELGRRGACRLDRSNLHHNFEAVERCCQTTSNGRPGSSRHRWCSSEGRSQLGRLRAGVLASSDRGDGVRGTYSPLIEVSPRLEARCKLRQCVYFGAQLTDLRSQGGVLVSTSLLFSGDRSVHTYYRGFDSGCTDRKRAVTVHPGRLFSADACFGSCGAYVDRFELDCRQRVGFSSHTLELANACSVAVLSDDHALQGFSHRAVGVFAAGCLVDDRGLSSEHPGSQRSVGSFQSCLGCGSSSLNTVHAGIQASSFACEVVAYTVQTDDFSGSGSLYCCYGCVDAGDQTVNSGCFGSQVGSYGRHVGCDSVYATIQAGRFSDSSGVGRIDLGVDAGDQTVYANDFSGSVRLCSGDVSFSGIQQAVKARNFGGQVFANVGQTLIGFDQGIRYGVDPVVQTNRF